MMRDSDPRTDIQPLDATLPETTESIAELQALQKQIEKDLKKHYKITEIKC